MSNDKWLGQGTPTPHPDGEGGGGSSALSPRAEKAPELFKAPISEEVAAFRRKLLEAPPPTISPAILDDVVAAVREESGAGAAGAARTAEHLRVFLMAYAETGRVSESSSLAGISPAAVHEWRHRLPVFAQAMEAAITVYRESLIREVHRRAVKGVDEPVFFQGEICGHIRRYSDRLLELEVKRHVPEYREKREVDINISAGVLVVGAPKTEDEWLDKFRPEPPKVIDVTPEEEKKP